MNAFPLLPEVHTAPGKVSDGILLLEGGSMRGIYSAGVCDVLMEEGIHMRCVAGVSAGALNALNILGRQVGRFASIVLLHRSDPRYTGVGSFLENGGLVGFRFLFREMEKVYPMGDPFNEPNRTFVALATNCKTGKPVCFDRGTKEELLTATQASASLAFACRTVELMGKTLLDGGYSESIPLQYALLKGYDKKIAVLTRPLSYRKEPVKKETMRRMRSFYRAYPKFCDTVERLPAEYARTRERLEALRNEGNAFVFAPSQPIEISSMEKDTAKLYEVYTLGRRDAENALPALRAYLEK